MDERFEQDACHKNRGRCKAEIDRSRMIPATEKEDL